MHSVECKTHTKDIISNETFPKGELGSWKHTYAFHKKSKTNLHQTLKLI